MQELKAEFKRKLSEKNYKFTKQRELIIDTIITKGSWHFTAEDLFEELRKKDSEIGMATVYRTIELLKDLNIIHVLDFNEESRKYELVLEDSHHHHLICKECGKLIEFNDQDIDYFEKELEKKYDFKVTEHKLSFYGYCSECRKKK
jgi:Fur family ferric uptake transcriptional regulator